MRKIVMLPQSKSTKYQLAKKNQQRSFRSKNIDTPSSSQLFVLELKKTSKLNPCDSTIYAFNNLHPTMYCNIFRQRDYYFQVC